MKPGDFRYLLHDDRIVVAIREAEGRTSGEIRVFIGQEKIENAIAAGQAAFVRLGMTNTKERNGVLIFVAPLSHKFAVIGDKGVHERCGDEFWRQLTEEMSSHFKSSHFTDGIIHAVSRAGDLLAQHFPRRQDDKNELSDDVARD
jgi:uncharacterized membrane protein